MCEIIQQIRCYICNLNIDSEMVIAIVALIISIIALIYTIATYMLKRGVKIRGSFIACGTFETKDNYIHEVYLENMKDKPLVIYNIYLQIGHNIYVDLLNHPNDFNDTIKPIIIPPYEVKIIQFGPQLFYDDGCSVIDNISDYIYGEKNIKKKLVLSTNEGKIRVKSNIKMWDPLYDFSNHYTQIIRPHRLYCDGNTYEATSFGSNTLYVVKVLLRNKETMLCPIYKGRKGPYFPALDLTEDVLRTKESLTLFLKHQSEAGSIDCEILDVADYKTRIDDIKKDRERYGVHQVKPFGWFEYYIVGRIYSFVKNYKTKLRNNQIQRDNKKRRCKNS